MHTDAILTVIPIYVHTYETIPSTAPYTRSKACHKFTDPITLAKADDIYCFPAMTVCSIFIQKSQPAHDCNIFDCPVCNFPKLYSQAQKHFSSHIHTSQNLGSHCTPHPILSLYKQTEFEIVITEF